MGRSSALPFRCQRPARRPARPAGRRGWQARWRKLLMALLPQEIIRKKRDGAALGDGEIEALVAGIADGSLGEGQVGAFAMAAFLCGMNAQETVALTRAMTASGRRLDWRPFDLPGPVPAKHYPGGVGYKGARVLAPIDEQRVV